MKFDDLCEVQYLQLIRNYVVIKIRNFELSIVGMSKLLVLLF